MSNAAIVSTDEDMDTLTEKLAVQLAESRALGDVGEVWSETTGGHWDTLTGFALLSNAGYMLVVDCFGKWDLFARDEHGEFELLIDTGSVGA